MNFSIDTDQEDDGRWIAEVPDLPGVLAYGATREEAQARAQVLALRVIAEQLEHGEARARSTYVSLFPPLASVTFVEGLARTCRATPNGLAPQASVGLSPNP